MFNAAVAGGGRLNGIEEISRPPVIADYSIVYTCNPGSIAPSDEETSAGVTFDVMTVIQTII